MSRGECYTELLTFEKAIVTRAIGNLIAKAIKEDTDEEYIQRYTSVKKDGSVVIKFLGLSSRTVFEFIETAFPYANVYYNDSWLNWKYENKWSGIPSINVDITKYVNA
jgi:hypothetical protein